MIDELERIWKETGSEVVEVPVQHLPVGIEKNREKQCTRCPGLDSERTPPELLTGILLIN
jgi:hypothetical protein